MAGTKDKARVWEIDFFRGLLIIYMIFIHIMYDLQYIYNINVNYDGGILQLSRIIFSPCFIIVSGISTAFSRNSFKRGLIVFLTAMGLTLVTFIADRELFIVFGILHFLGIWMMISPLFKKLPTFWIFVSCGIFVVISLLIPYVKVDHNYLSILGFHNASFSSLDYYPLLEYGWAFLLGMGLSKLLYKEKKSIFPFTIKSKVVNFIGRNSLYIYVVHQPIILLLLKLILE
jgi:uncharacterized membrane protein